LHAEAQSCALRQPAVTVTPTSPEAVLSALPVTLVLLAVWPLRFALSDPELTVQLYELQFVGHADSVMLTA
jgi:hypothetical protein